NGKIVAVRAGKIMATAFHPEIVGERRVHEYFLGMLS
ncbi:MAG: pyridoxal 5'-phosphate synthase glutaminase subunit PdxT, partial [Actinomycetota bacterium]